MGSSVLNRPLQKLACQSAKMPAGIGSWRVFPLALLALRGLAGPATPSQQAQSGRPQAVQGGHHFRHSSVRPTGHYALRNVVRGAWLAVALPLAIFPEMKIPVLPQPSSSLTPVSSRTELKGQGLQTIMYPTSTGHFELFRAAEASYS